MAHVSNQIFHLELARPSDHLSPEDAVLKLNPPRLARVVRQLSALAVVGAFGLSALGQAAPTTIDGSSVERVGVTKLTYRPATVSGMVENPLRGMYRWSGSESVSADIPANDRYERDRVYWGRIEPADNEFNFSWIQQGLDDARARGAKFGFRVMAYCPGCWMEYRPDTNNWPQITPAFIPTQPGTTAPDWNSETFLSQWEELMTALGDEFGDDPALGYVDVGGYGMYGEWHVRPGGASGPDGVPATTESMQRIVNAVSAAFPTKHLLINTMTSVDFTLWALNSNPLMGMRTDNLGAPNMYSMVTVDTRLQQVW